jgi:hypothetical protein
VTPKLVPFSGPDFGAAVKHKKRRKSEQLRLKKCNRLTKQAHGWQRQFAKTEKTHCFRSCPLLANLSLSIFAQPQNETPLQMPIIAPSPKTHKTCK